MIEVEHCPMAPKWASFSWGSTPRPPFSRPSASIMSAFGLPDAPPQMGPRAPKAHGGKSLNFFFRKTSANFSEMFQYSGVVPPPLEYRNISKECPNILGVGPEIIIYARGHISFSGRPPTEYQNNSWECSNIMGGGSPRQNIGPGWARPWPRLGPSLVQVGPHGGAQNQKKIARGHNSTHMRALNISTTAPGRKFRDLQV